MLFTEEKKFHYLRSKIMSMQGLWTNLLTQNFPSEENHDSHRWYHNKKVCKNDSFIAFRLFWHTYLREYQSFDAKYINLLSLAKSNNVVALINSEPRFCDLVESKRIKKWYPQYFLADESKEANIIYAAARFRRQGMLDHFYQLGLTWDEDRGWTSSLVSSLVGPPLHLAVMCNQEEACRRLLQSGAKTEERGYGHTTALHLAAHYGYESLVRLLIEAGANVNAWDSHHHTPLHYAAFNGHANIVSLLLTQGPMLDLQTMQRRTALFLATFRGHNHVVAMLLNAGAALRFDQDPSVREVAVMFAHLEIIQLLIKNSSTELIDLMLATAVLRKQFEVVRLLLRANANPNGFVRNFAFTYEGRQDVPLIVIAAKNGSSEILALLFQYDADPLTSFNGQDIQFHAANKRIRQICAEAKKRKVKQNHLILIERFLKNIPEGDVLKRRAAICLKESIEAEKASPDLEKHRKQLQDLTHVEEIFIYWFPSLGTSMKNKVVTFFSKKMTVKMTTNDRLPDNTPGP